MIITAGGKNLSPSNIEDALRSELIANPVVIGDGRPYIVALLTLDASALESFASRHGLPAQPDELRRHPTLLDAIQQRVDTVNSGLANVEQVRRWVVLPGEFAIGVELTPTYKVRRRVVAERFAAEIEALYAPRQDAVRPVPPS